MKNSHYLFNYNTSETEFEGTYEECYEYAVASGFTHEIGCIGSSREPGDLMNDFGILEVYDLEQNIPTTASNIQHFTVKTYALGPGEKQSGDHLYTIKGVFWIDDVSFDHEFGSEGGIVNSFDFDLKDIFGFDWAEEDAKNWLAEKCADFVCWDEVEEEIDLTV